MDNAFSFKVIIIGDSGVGKSSFLKRYIDNTYKHNSGNSTIGVDFASRSTSVKINEKYVTARLQIWDTAGQESYRTLTSSYYRNCDIVIIMYDVSNPKTIESLEYWISEVDKMCPKSNMFIIGNKIDLPDNHIYLNKANQIHFFTSCKNNTSDSNKEMSVESIMKNIITNTINKHLNDNIKITDKFASNDMSNNIVNLTGSITSLSTQTKCLC